MIEKESLELTNKWIRMLVQWKVLLTNGWTWNNSIHSIFDEIIWWSTKSSLDKGGASTM